MPTPTNPIRVALVDDKLMVREGICALLERQPGFDVVAQVASVAEAAAVDVRADVVIADLVLPDARGTQVINGLQRHFPHAAVFVLVDHADAVELSEGGGVRGYLLKTAAAVELLAGLRAVAQGVDYVHPGLRTATAAAGAAPNGTAPTVVIPPQPGSETKPVGALTEKEREVLRFLVFGHTNAEIAALCGVSLRTVEARRARVLQKLGVRTRADLVRVARQAGGIDIQLA